MKLYGRRLVLISAMGVILAFGAQLVSRNFYIGASVDYASETSTGDSLTRTRQALISRIAQLESPVRLREVGDSLGLSPLPVESFILMEVAR